MNLNRHIRSIMDRRNLLVILATVAIIAAIAIMIVDKIERDWNQGSKAPAITTSSAAIPGPQA